MYRRASTNVLKGDKTLQLVKLKNTQEILVEASVRDEITLGHFSDSGPSSQDVYIGFSNS